MMQSPSISIHEECRLGALFLKMNGEISSFLGVVLCIGHRNACGWPMLLYGLPEYIFSSRLLNGLKTGNERYLNQWIIFTSVLILVALCGVIPMMLDEPSVAGLLRALPWILLLKAQALVHLYFIVVVLFCKDLMKGEEELMWRLTNWCSCGSDLGENDEVADDQRDDDSCKGCQRERSQGLSKNELKAARRLKRKIQRGTVVKICAKTMHRFTNWMPLEDEACWAVKGVWATSMVALCASAILSVRDLRHFPWLFLSGIDWLFTSNLYDSLQAVEPKTVRAWVVYSCLRLVVVTATMLPSLFMGVLRGEFYETTVNLIFLVTMGLLRLRCMFLFNACVEKMERGDFVSPWHRVDPPDPLSFGPDVHWFYCPHRGRVTIINDYEVAYNPEQNEAPVQEVQPPSRGQPRGQNARRRRRRAAAPEERARPIRAPAALRGDRLQHDGGGNNGRT